MISNKRLVSASDVFKRRGKTVYITKLVVDDVIKSKQLILQNNEW